MTKPPNGSKPEFSDDRLAWVVTPTEQPSELEHEMQRLDWVITPSTRPGNLAPEDVEQIDQLSADLAELQPSVKTENRQRRVSANRGVSPAVGAAPRRRLWLATLGGGIAAGLLFVVWLQTRDSDWNNEAPIASYGNRLVPGERLPPENRDEVSPRHKVALKDVVLAEFSLERQVADFTGEGWLVASRNVGAIDSASEADYAAAVEEFENQMEALRGQSEVDAADWVRIGAWRIRRGEAGLAQAAFRQATQRDPKLTKAWIGLALATALLTPWAGDPAVLQNQLATWLQKPKESSIGHDERLQEAVKGWLRTADPSVVD